MGLQVPCGKCDGCQADKALSWSLRIHQEASLHKQNAFVTLTYDEEHLPADGKISKTHLRNFIKKARHEYSFRYFACGEYGDKTSRPHYHAIIFGQDFREGRTIQINQELYCNNNLQEIWGKGAVVCAPYTMATGCYVSGYVAKKVGNADTFSVMSRGRRPDGGIGYRWLQKYYDDIIRTGVCVVEGREYPVPQRYLQWMEEELAGVKAERLEKVKERESRLGLFEIMRERAAKEILQKQRINNRKGNEKL